MLHRWSRIAAQLPGRTDNEIKNYWNTRLKKKLRHMGLDPSTHKPFQDSQLGQADDSPEASEFEVVDCDQISEDDHHMLTVAVDSFPPEAAADEGLLQQDLELKAYNDSAVKGTPRAHFSQSNFAEDKANPRDESHSVPEKLLLLPHALHVAQAGGLSTESKSNVPQVFESMNRRGVCDRGRSPQLEDYKLLLQKVPRQSVMQLDTAIVDASIKEELAAVHDEEQQPLSPTSVIHRGKSDEDSEDSNPTTSRDDPQLNQTRTGLCCMPAAKVPGKSSEERVTTAPDGQKFNPVMSAKLGTHLCDGMDSHIMDILSVVKSEDTFAAISGEFDPTSGAPFNEPSSCQQFGKISKQDIWGDFTSFPLHSGDVGSSGLTSQMAGVEYVPHQWSGMASQWAAEGGGHDHTSYEAASTLTPWQRASSDSYITDYFYNSIPTPYPSQELQRLAAILDEI